LISKNIPFSPPKVVGINNVFMSLARVSWDIKRTSGTEAGSDSCLEIRSCRNGAAQLGITNDCNLALFLTAAHARKHISRPIIERCSYPLPAFESWNI
jgi:hypothetical protein